LKEKLKDHELSTAEHIIEAITATWDSVTFNELQSMFSEWIQKLTWAIAERGKYCTRWFKQFIHDVRSPGKIQEGQTFLGPYTYRVFNSDRGIPKQENG
jgi:hypothetical protein